MSLHHDTRSDGMRISELSDCTERSVIEATLRLAPQYDDICELQEAVLSELHGLHGFEPGEDLLVIECVDACAPELARGPEYFARLQREDAARAKWPPRVATAKDQSEIAGMQDEFTARLRAMVAPKRGVA